MADPVVHFELNLPDAEGAGTFYSELFGWHTQSTPTPEGVYLLVDTHSGKGINGGIGQSQDGRAWSTVYIGTPDPQAVLDKAESRGGKTLMPVTDMEMVTVALFADPQGNTIGLVKTTDQPGPGVSAGDDPTVDWFEILGPDPKALWKFYGEIFGWDVHGSDSDQVVYGMIDASGGGIGGGIGDSPDGLPHVNIYAEVDDLQRYLDRAEELGGKTIVPVTEVPNMVTFAMFSDSSGGTFGLYKSQQ